METRLPGGVLREEMPDGVRYTLPGRPSLGGMIHIPLLLGVLFTFAGSLVAMLIPDRPPPGDGWIVWVFGYGFGSIGLFVLGLGILTSFGRGEIEVDAQEFRVRTRVGFLTWSRRRPRAGLLRLSAVLTPAERNGTPVSSGPGSDWGMLRAHWSDGGETTVASAYPYSWLAGVAADLAKRIGVGAELLENGRVRSSGPAPLARPAGSRAEVETSAGGLVVRLPARGIRRGSRGYAAFGAGWIGMCAFLSGWAWFLTRGEPWSFAGIAVFMVLFAGVGFALLAGGIQLGRRRATIEAAGGRLTIRLEGPFGRKELSWALAEIRSIACAPNGDRTNGVPHLALRIHAGKEPEFILEERDADELRWIAGLLAPIVGSARKG